MSLLRRALLLLCVATAVDANLQLRSGKKHHKHHKHHKSSQDAAVLLADSSGVSIPINQAAPSSAYAHPSHHHKKNVKHVKAAAVASEPVPAAAVASEPVPAAAMASEPVPAAAVPMKVEATVTPSPAASPLAGLANAQTNTPTQPTDPRYTEIEAEVKAAKKKEGQIAQLKAALATQQSLVEQTATLAESFNDDQRKGFIVKDELEQTKGMMQKDLELLVATKDEAAHSSQKALEEAQEMHQAALNAEEKAEKERAASMELEGKASDLMTKAQEEVSSVQATIKAMEQSAQSESESD